MSVLLLLFIIVCLMFTGGRKGRSPKYWHNNAICYSVPFGLRYASMSLAV